MDGSLTQVFGVRALALTGVAGALRPKMSDVIPRIVRMLRADSDVTAICAELSRASEAALRASATSTDERVRNPANRAAEMLDQALTGTVGFEPTERLTVALLGRTKAGKSQLVAALTGDSDASGVGVGRHRTTRTERVVHLPEFDLVDLPGVSALDGEEDTALALAMAERADAVLWIYAESLQEAEAFELEDLMRRGKPVVVAFNVKQRVDPPALRKVFAKYPGRTFRDLESHEARIAQIADRAGTHAPPFVPFHARAAWWAACDDDPVLGTASRIHDLTTACDSVLVSRASVLRIRAEHDHPRRQLVELGASAALVAGELGEDQGTLARLIDRECDAILDRAAILQSDATAQLGAAVAKAKHRLDRWLTKHRGDGGKKLNSAWQTYLEDSGMFRVLTDYDDRLRERLTERRIATVALRFKEPDPSTGRRLKSAPGRGAWGWVKSGFRAVRRSAVGAVRALGVDRGLAMLFAKLAGRAVPGVGWWLVGVDALQGLSQGAREELAARRISVDAWAADQRSACLRFISSTEASIRSVLKKSDRTLRTTVENHRNAARQALDESAAVRDGLLRAAEAAEDATSACDRDLVSALLAHDRFSLRVNRVRRVPNRSLEVEFGGSGDRVRAIEALNRNLAPETVSDVSSNRLPALARHARQKV